MKRFYTLCLFVFALTLNLAAQVCVPDPAVIAAGVPGPTPSSQTGLPSATLNAAYSQNITFVVPADTTITLPLVGAVTVTVNYWEITGATGLPTGLSEACNVSPCTWVGGTNGCINISGTPTVAGSYTAQITGNLNVNLPPPVGGSQNVPTPMPYTMSVDDPNSIGDVLNVNAFGISQNVPNPSNGATTIKFSSPKPAEVSFTLVNQFGQVVMVKNIRTTSGINELNVDVSSLANGVYFYSMNNGDAVTSTRKMVVLE